MSQVTNVESTKPFLPPSYVWPYTLMFGTGGWLLSYATRTPTFFLASIPFGVASGMIRDRNVQVAATQSAASTVASTALKGILIYTCGPTLIFVAVCGIVVLAL